jgi:hypothetical protein
LGLAIPSGLTTASAIWLGERSPWVLGLFFVLTAALCSLLLLVFLGYRQERSISARREVPSPAIPAAAEATLTEVYPLLDKARPFPDFQTLLLSSLFNGAVQAWGRFVQAKSAWGDSAPEQLIPPDYWADSTFDWISVNGTDKTIPGDGKRQYRNVRFNTAQIRQLCEKLASGNHP